MDIDMLVSIDLKVMLSDTWAHFGNLRSSSVWRWKVSLGLSSTDMLVLQVQWERTWTQTEV